MTGTIAGGRTFGCHTTDGSGESPCWWGSSKKPEPADCGATRRAGQWRRL